MCVEPARDDRRDQDENAAERQSEHGEDDGLPTYDVVTYSEGAGDRS